MFPRHLLSAAGILALALAASGTASAAPVYANSPVSGDAFSFNLLSLRSGQQLGTSGWYYNNVGSGGSVGVDGTRPRAGNGSVGLSTANTSSKADIEFLAGATANVVGNYAATGSLGLFSALTSFSYDWYRNGGGTASAGLHPSLRVLLDLDGDLRTTGDRGGLVFEGVYNGAPSAPTDQWVSSTVDASTNLWNFGLGLGNNANINATPYAFDATLAQWQAYAPNAVIMGFSSGVGSGWGSFAGAVDNIAWTIGGVTTTSNFEVRPLANAVPEPASLALAGLALAGLAIARRRRA